MFSRNKPKLIDPPPCKHKWQDFPWIFTYVYDTRPGGGLYITITEPYVCIYCKKRKNVVLLEETYHGIGKKEMLQIIRDKQEEYKDHIKPEAIVEDMINDFQLVDREWLKIAYALRNQRQQNDL